MYICFALCWCLYFLFSIFKPLVLQNLSYKCLFMIARASRFIARLCKLLVLYQLIHIRKLVYGGVFPSNQLRFLCSNKCDIRIIKREFCLKQLITAVPHQFPKTLHLVRISYIKHILNILPNTLYITQVCMLYMVLIVS